MLKKDFFDFLVSFLRELQFRQAMHVHSSTKTSNVATSKIPQPAEERLTKPSQVRPRQTSLRSTCHLFLLLGLCGGESVTKDDRCIPASSAATTLEQQSLQLQQQTANAKRNALQVDSVRSLRFEAPFLVTSL